MPEFFKTFLTSGGYLPHGHCYLWQSKLVWLHIVSDSLIALAYYSIPLMLVYFVRKRRDVPFDWIFLMFGSFIIACGTTHLMEIWTLWYPTYWLSGGIKALTAVVSLATAFLLGELMPKALTLPSPAQLEAANLALRNEITQRQLAEGALQRVKVELEIRVQERTAELATTNESLQAEIAERKKAEKQIQKSLREKEVLLQEIHHRVKNNLQVISSLLDLQSQYTKEPALMEMFKDCCNRVKSMALVHEKLYQSQDLASINFAEYIQSLTRDLFQTYGEQSGNINIVLDIEEVTLKLNAAINCGLIINELVSNALKYAFPNKQQGIINIMLHSDVNKYLTLIVKDNGVGFSKIGDFKSAKSLGLQLVQVLTEQLDGILELDSSRGADFCLKFPQLPEAN